MKKILLTSLLLVTMLTGVYAQWVSSGNNLLYSAGKIGIGTSSLPAALTISSPFVAPPSGANVASNFVAGTFSVLGNTAGSYLYPFEFQHSNAGNIDRLLFSPYRRVAGPNWQGTAYRMQIAVDNSFTAGDKAYVEIGVSDPNSSGGGFISLGTEGQDRLVVTSAGTVGIGTLDTKGYKLAVAGNAVAESITVKLRGLWPDFVFDHSYKLKSLEEIEIFLLKNKHLPEIPSAKEVNDNGIELGQMNAKLLQKIEELTLILIDQNKRLKELESKQKSKL
jgi:hypothetical protein